MVATRTKNPPDIQRNDVSQCGNDILSSYVSLRTDDAQVDRVNRPCGDYQSRDVNHCVCDPHRTLVDLPQGDLQSIIVNQQTHGIRHRSVGQLSDDIR